MIAVKDKPSDTNHNYSSSQVMSSFQIWRHLPNLASFAVWGNGMAHKLFLSALVYFILLCTQKTSEWFKHSVLTVAARILRFEGILIA